MQKQKKNYGTSAHCININVELIGWRHIQIVKTSQVSFDFIRVSGKNFSKFLSVLKNIKGLYKGFIFQLKSVLIYYCFLERCYIVE